MTIALWITSSLLYFCLGVILENVRARTKKAQGYGEHLWFAFIWPVRLIDFILPETVVHND